MMALVNSRMSRPGSPELLAYFNVDGGCIYNSGNLTVHPILR